jgi:hypothetical protein
MIQQTIWEDWHSYLLETLHYLTNDIVKSDINNDLSKLSEWAKLWLVDFNKDKNLCYLN